MATFLAHLRRSFAVHSSRVALEFARRSYRFCELEASAERIAALFQAQGLSRGDRIVLVLEAKEPLLLAYLGALWAGLVPITVNPESKPIELAYFLRDSAARGLVVEASTASVVDSLNPPPCIVHAADLLHRPAPQRYRAWDASAEDPALILYSSGTTGEPKGVVHTQANLDRAVSAIAQAWRFAPDDVLANVLPLFHIHGLSFASNVSLVSGSTMVVADRFHPLRVLDLIERATVFMGVPPYYYALLKRHEFRQRARRWHRLRLVTSGSAPVRAEVLPKLESILGRPVINRYGMTECHVLTSLPLDGPWPHGSVGIPLDGIELAVQSEADQPCTNGEVGRVYARGPNLFREYWNRPEATAASFDRGGWFDTGDLGTLDPAGFLTLVGRSNDLIIVGGLNVYPAIVERALGECPGIRESAVVGVPDPERGERVAAFVVTDDQTLDAKRIRDYCHSRLTDYQCPSRVEIVPSLPRNSMGKVLKRELRERLGQSLAP
jgi:malonyl-CoA/methylmalonyl-CoA synthetase